jgi:ABC-type dipeptide/oligopeptide/nickel transport system permease component
LLHTFFALVVAVLLAVPAGVISATRASSWVDNFISLGSPFWISMPGFWIAMIPTVTIFGLQIPELLSLAVIIETVFAWPGMGRMLVNAVLKRDYTLVQGIVLVYALIVILINLIVDLLYAYIDPRIKHE